VIFPRSGKSSDKAHFRNPAKVVAEAGIETGGALESLFKKVTAGKSAVVYPEGIEVMSNTKVEILRLSLQAILLPPVS